MMKKTFFYAVSAFLMLSACTQELVSDIQEQPTLKEGGATIAATINDESATRVAVDQAGIEGKTTLKWEAGNRVLVASGQRGYTFKGNFTATQADGNFTLFQEETGSSGSFSATKVNEAYSPATAWDYSGSDPVYTFPAEQVYTEGTFDRNAMPLTASSSDGNFAFSIEAAVLRLNVSTAVAGTKLSKITLTSKKHNLSGNAFFSYTDDLKPSSGEGANSVSLLCADAGVGTTAKPFYIVVPAGAYESGDLTLTFDANTGADEKASIKTFNLGVGKVYDMNLSITPEKDPVDLSADGTANCYIVSEYGPCKFDATKKGHTSESVGTVASAEVLWESFCNDVQPTVGDIVKDVAVKNGIVSFTASGKDGNAVIAVKDAAGDILWSWHIWVCKGFDPAATAQVYYNNAGTVMDRNLGATSAKKGDVKALGLLYQWGRKDPFLSGQSINSSTQAKSTITWPSKVSSNSSNGTIDFVVKHPTTFVTYNSNNGDWYYTGSSSTDDTRWNSSKGMYDPCPKGWRVPDGGHPGLWCKALGSTSSFSGPWDSTNKGMDFAGKFSAASEVWYPASGYLYLVDGTLNNVGYYGDYWSCTPVGGGNANYLSFNSDGYVHPYDYSNIRATGESVRCVKEGTTPEPEPEAKDLSADGTANCYIVSEYGPCKFDATKKGHTSESVGTIASAEVLWESLGNDVQPTVGDIVKDIAVKNGIVSFTASGMDGNAVIAVKDAAGDILWSWHIWVCKGFDPAATAQVYYNNAGTVMDRNLGATSAKKGDVKALGLLYQWGRKDPFLGSSSISSGSTKAKSTTSWPSPVNSNASNGTIDFVVKHPTTLVGMNSNNDDWYYTGSSSTDNTRWNSSKGMYDPCPKGWRVPDGGSNGVWAKALGTSSGWKTSSNWDSTNRGMDFGSTDKVLGSGSIWYPASGFLQRDGALGSVGRYGNYWSCTPRPNGGPAYGLDFGSDGSVGPSVIYGNRAVGNSVRCVKEYAPEPGPEAKDLSADGAANCYIVSEYGPCKFDATKKGHTSESVGTIASAEVLWESFGNDVQPTVGDIVKDVAVKNGIVSFTASGKDGNAVIAVKNAAGDILWSWHIWVCKDFDPAATAQVYKNNAGIVMDRNLGATSATKGDVKALGLLYQWGRKDPFLSGESISSDTRAKSTITWPSKVSSNSSNGTIDFVVKHPTTFVTYNSDNDDWYYTGSSSTDNTRWNSSKGMYDPCPKGWKVPDGGSNGLWAKAKGSSLFFGGDPFWDSTNKGMDFAGKFSTASEVWYPASGYLFTYDGTLDFVGDGGYYWSCTPSGGSAYHLDFDNILVYPSYDYPRAYGQSVRCLQE